MNYNPMSDEDIERASLISEGTQCYVEVLETRDHIGKDSGKESIMLKLAIWEGDMIRTHLFVYLTPAYMKLFKHACVAMLGQNKYDSGNIQAVNFENKGCNAIIGIERGKNGYKDKNIINDFLPATSAPAPESYPSQQAPSAPAEDLPF